MNIEALILGLVSGLRPATAQAAVIALLKAPAAARTLLAFTLAGFASSVLIGIVVFFVLDGAGGTFGHSRFAAVFDVVVGVAALGFAAGVQRGGLSRRRERPPNRATSAIATRLQRPSMATAAAAGVATHVPGLIYLAALNSIAADRPGVADAILQVAIYNALWFVVPLGALVLVIRSPATASLYLDRLTGWARRNQERLVVVLFGALGLYLTVKGAVELMT